MVSIRACLQCLMKSVFVFCQHYILLGPPPMGLLQTHMEVICSNSSAEKEIRGSTWPWDLGLGNQFEELGLGWNMFLAYVEAGFL